MKHTVIHIREGRMVRQVLDHMPTLAELQSWVAGDFFEIVRVEPRQIGETAIVCVVNADGIRLNAHGRSDMAPMLWLASRYRRPTAIYGPLSIMAEDGPEIVGLTPQQEARIALHWKEGAVKGLLTIA